MIVRVAALAFVVLAVAGAASARTSAVRTLTFEYRSHAGVMRTAYLVLPAWYGPQRHPPIPFVISPHGRGVSGSYNLRFWGDLPARGPFALVSPDGHGRKLPFYSWGYRRQVDDLAKMPVFAERAFPWLRLDMKRIYAIGDSMGGQEALLMMARRTTNLAGVIALDPVTDMSARYRRWFVTPGEEKLPAKARIEFGGTPSQLPLAYADRSPKTFLHAIARSGVPLQLWWSYRDSTVTHQAQDTGAFRRRLLAVAPNAPVQEVVGYWEHAHEMHPETQLPSALACFGLIPSRGISVPAFESRNGSIEQLPPEQGRDPVSFGPAFCGKAR